MKPHQNRRATSRPWKKPAVTSTRSKRTCRNYKRMEVVIDHLQRKPHPIEGIFHSAVVFRDGWMTEMSHDDWMDVMMPKAYGCLVPTPAVAAQELATSALRYLLVDRWTGRQMRLRPTTACRTRFLLSLGDLRRSLGLPSSVACFGVHQLYWLRLS